MRHVEIRQLPFIIASFTVRDDVSDDEVRRLIVQLLSVSSFAVTGQQGFNNGKIEVEIRRMEQW